jgi:hypothetical protein
MRRYRFDAITLSTITAAVVAILPVSGGADTFNATLGQPLREVSHAVDVRLDEGVATYTVRRSFANSGQRHDEASVGIIMPYGAAATGLRIRSAKRWYRGELMERDQAAELYRELTGMGPHAPRDPALLQWVWANEVHLQVFPVPPGRTATVEYTLTAPTRYVGGRQVISYPRPDGDPSLAPPVMRVFPESATANITVDGMPAAKAQPVVIPRPSTESWLGDHTLDPGGSYVFSAIPVQVEGRLVAAEVSVDIRHTYRGGTWTAKSWASR